MIIMFGLLNFRLVFLPLDAMDWEIIDGLEDQPGAGSLAQSVGELSDKLS